jgi:hypothetical protein
MVHVLIERFTERVPHVRRQLTERGRIRRARVGAFSLQLELCIDAAFRVQQ